MTLTQSFTAIFISIITVCVPLLFTRNKKLNKEKELERLLITKGLAEDCLTLLDIEKEHTEIHKLNSTNGMKNTVRDTVHKCSGRKLSKRCSRARLAMVIASIEQQVETFEK
ncbi:conserved hypothetical protein [Vibrio chagasii]|nr:conserved hypothetical protein [Vibrio chagasii]CAH6947889.1 conserved hypothetical protein [Vibrio chagasii]|eukprot:GHVR01046854.1.p3 GENE.GHVR01046854.1~~GHVR01046854.1.p3  ORF type:complete len:112 (-),score=1.65 GHVR01046854.1:1017-1352(-)